MERVRWAKWAWVSVIHLCFTSCDQKWFVFYFDLAKFIFIKKNGNTKSVIYSEDIFYILMFNLDYAHAKNQLFGLTFTYEDSQLLFPQIKYPRQYDIVNLLI